MMRTTTWRKYLLTNDEINRKRAEKIEVVMRKYPNRIPVMCHKSNSGITLKINVSSKVLVPDDYAFSQFTAVMRHQADLAPHEALFFFINQTIIPPYNTKMRELYNKYKEADGMLHIHYSTESAFG